MGLLQKVHIFFINLIGIMFYERTYDTTRECNECSFLKLRIEFKIISIKHNPIIFCEEIEISHVYNSGTKLKATVLVHPKD